MTLAVVLTVGAVGEAADVTACRADDAPVTAAAAGVVVVAAARAVVESRFVVTAVGEDGGDTARAGAEAMGAAAAA